jgi:hypothetical protein
MSAAALVPYTVSAFNSSRESENKIHDDAVAGRFGFRGGLVPGVDVYAYMTHLPVAKWGRAWLERGTATCRFDKPVYDGEDATVTAQDGAAGLDIRVESHGELCATGVATLPATATTATPSGETPATPPATRPDADETTLRVGMLFAMTPLAVTDEFAGRYLADVRETDPLYRREGLMHPGLILRTCNWVLMHNVKLGPWIHVGSAVRNIAAGRVGTELSAHARVAANYERKGHRFVEVDALVMAGGASVAHILHTAIYRPRQLNG